MDLNRWKVFRNLDPAVAAQVKLAYTWGTGKAGFLVLDNDDVYYVGHDEAYFLAGDKTANFLLKITALCGAGIKDFQCGKDFVMALTKDGKVYEWSYFPNAPKLHKDFPEDRKITQIAAGSGHRAALTSRGEVFCWGANNLGQVGNGSNEFKMEPQNIFPFSGAAYAKSIACGDSSTFVVAKDGNVWGWGNRQEMGNGIATNQNTPRLVLDGKSITKISCSSTCTLAVSDEDYLYGWAHQKDGMTTRKHIRGECANSVLDVGSSIHSSFIAYSTTRAVSVVGLWCGKYCDRPVMTSYSTIDEAFASCTNPTIFRPITPLRSPVSASQGLLEALFNDDVSSDVKFTVGSQVIYAHKLILTKRSPYFAKMFGHDWKDSTIDGAIPIESYSYDVFRGFLNYLYTERIESLDFDIILDLLKAADFYQENELVRKCEQLLKLACTTKNVCLVYSVATGHNAKNLKQYALGFARRHFTDVTKSGGFAALDNDLKTQLIRELANNRRLVALWGSDAEGEEEDKNAEGDEFIPAP